MRDEQSLFYERVYSETRNDVRVYASLVFQAITLFLTTLMLVVGWGAKDFMIEKYRLAEQPAVGPMSTAAVSERFYLLLAQSLVTSLILLALSIFVSTLMCTIVVLGYVVENRRNYGHVLAHAMGTPDTDAQASGTLHRALTSTAVNLFAGFVLVVAFALLAGSLTQTVYVLWKIRPLPPYVFATLCVVAALASYKFVSSVILAWRYRAWSRRLGHASRWRRAAPILDEIGTAPNIISAGSGVGAALDSLKRKATQGESVKGDKYVAAAAITDLWLQLALVRLGEKHRGTLERLADVLHCRRYVDWRASAAREDER